MLFPCKTYLLFLGFQYNIATVDVCLSVYLLLIYLIRYNIRVGQYVKGREIQNVSH